MSEPRISKKRIRELVAKEWTHQRIADELGCSRAYVGWVMRSPEKVKLDRKRNTRQDRQRVLLKRLERDLEKGRPFSAAVLLRVHRESKLDPAFGERIRKVVNR
jgi:predicted transcriptional regulator